jgi:hypothetical protein
LRKKKAARGGPKKSLLGSPENRADLRTSQASPWAGAYGVIPSPGAALAPDPETRLPWRHPGKTAAVLDLTLKRLEPALLGHGGWEYQYEVRLGGELIAKSRDPEFAACRTLAKSGRFGRARFWREGKAHPDISMDIALAAKWRTKETRKLGPQFARFEEFTASAYAQRKAA